MSRQLETTSDPRFCCALLRQEGRFRSAVTSIYVNYPNPHFSAKPGPIDERLRHDKPNRRVIRLTPLTFSKEMADFEAGEFRFAATSELNDAWIELDFDDSEFEMAVGRHIQRLFGRRYKPLANAPWK